MTTSGEQGAPVIEARELTKRFGELTAVDRVSLEVREGECVGLLGPNGAGKTSFVRMVYGFSPVSGGTLRVFGLDVSSHARAIKARIGVVPQEDNLDPVLTVEENLRVYAGYFRLGEEEAAARAREILEFVDLAERADEQVEVLSGGLKRRLALGRGLINRPHLLLLDEPTTGLDPFARHLVWQRLRRLKEGGTTMLLTTHYMEEAAQLCDRVVILYEGRIVEQGPPGELVHRHAGKEALELGVPDPDRQRLLRAGHSLIRGQQAIGEDLVLYTDRGLELLEVLCRRAEEEGIPLRSRGLRPSNLEDVFLMLTG
ncbi:MAG: ABC transporter ATP-binding protein, partial [Syntrophomonadaceae bacterium]|nr:ABC transporter ATP-binding protein [Syntrophomonadaceae bacterium]